MNAFVGQPDQPGGRAGESHRPGDLCGGIPAAEHGFCCPGDQHGRQGPHHRHRSAPRRNGRRA